MNLYAAQLFLLLVTLQLPGQSIYSLRIVSEGSPAACDDRNSLLCAEPRWLPERAAWVRPERIAEGAQRYGVVANELAAVSTWASGTAAPEGWPPLPERRWRGTSEELAQALAVVLVHEAGVAREDVHSGLTAYSRDDTARGDGGRSWCLTQQQMGRSPTARRRYPVDRWEARHLVGTDAASTRRCLIVGADVLASAAERCRRQRDPSSACLFAQYGGGGVRKDDKRVKARVATLAKVRRIWTELEGWQGNCRTCDEDP